MCSFQDTVLNLQKKWNKHIPEKVHILNLVNKNSISSMSNTHDEAKRATGRPRATGR